MRLLGHTIHGVGGDGGELDAAAAEISHPDFSAKRSAHLATANRPPLGR